MRKSHFACLLLGVVAGVALGFGMVIAQLKYGHTPVASVDPCDEGVCQSAVTEPTPLGNDVTEDEPTNPASPTASDAPASDEHGVLLGEPIQVPFGPVEVTMVHRPCGDVAVPVPQESNPLDGGVEAVERRMFNHLVRHMQTGGCEASEATAELLPMPSEERAASVREIGQYCMPTGCVPQLDQQYPPACSNPLTPKTAGKKQRLPYFGRYDAAIDCENHLTLPAEVHEMLANPRPRVLYLLPGNEPCLCLCTQGTLRKVFDGERIAGEASDYTDAERRIFLSKVRRVEVRADGTMELPADLVREAGLDGMPVVILGVEDHLEIWDRCRWNEYSEVASDVSFNDLTEIFTSVVAHVIGNLPLPLEICVPWDGMNWPTKELLNTSDDLSEIQAEWERIWFADQPSDLNPQRITGGIQ